MGKTKNGGKGAGAADTRKSSSSKPSSSKRSSPSYSNRKSKNQPHSSGEELDDEESEEVKPTKKKKGKSRGDIDSDSDVETDDDVYTDDDDEDASDDDDDDSRRKRSRRRRRSRSESGDSDSVLQKIRHMLRASLTHLPGKEASSSFSTSLYHNFQVVFKPDGSINKVTFAHHLNDILSNPSPIAKREYGNVSVSENDIQAFMEAMDVDGDETVDWDEFVSFMSFTDRELRNHIRNLRKTIKKKLEQNAFDINKVYNSLMDPKDKGHLSERALGKEIQSMLNIELSPGELREIFQLIDSDGDGKIAKDELKHFVESRLGDLFESKNGDFDDRAPIVEIELTTDQSRNTQKEENLKHMGFRCLREDLNGSIGLGPIWKGRKVRLWFKKERSSSPTYATKEDFRKARVTDICISEDQYDSVLVSQGFVKINQSLNSGTGAGTTSYMWIRRNPKDDNPILNVAVTTGDIKTKEDPIHFPPFHGYKRCPGILHKGGIASASVLLWYRKHSYKNDFNENNVDMKETEKDMMIVNRVRDVIREHCTQTGGIVNLKKSFSAYAENGVISRSAFSTMLEDDGLFIEKKELKHLLDVVDTDKNNKINMEEFVNFVQKGTKELDAMAIKVRRTIQGYARRHEKNLGTIFAKYDKTKTGSLNMHEFKVFLSEMRVTLTPEGMAKFAKPFDPDGSGRVAQAAFINFIHDSRIKYSKESLEEAYDVIKLRLAKIATKRNKKQWHRAFDHLKKSGRKSSHINSGDESDRDADYISTPALDRALEKILDDWPQRDSIGDEEIGKIVEHFDVEKNGKVTFEDFKEAITERFSAPKTLKRKTYKAEVQKNKKSQGIKKLLKRLCDEVETQLKKKGKKYSVKKAFDFFDSNDNHYLEKDDFVDVLDVLKLSRKLKDSEVEDLVNYFDVDGDGKIDYKEFQRALGKGGYDSSDGGPEVESKSRRRRRGREKKLKRRGKNSDDDFFGSESSESSKSSDSSSLSESDSSDSSLGEDQLFEKPRRRKKPAAKASEKVVKKVRHAMKRSRKKKGRSGFDLYKLLKRASKGLKRRTGTKNVIAVNDFTDVLEDAGIDLTKNDVKKLSKYFSTGKKKQLNYHKFLKAVSNEYAQKFGVDSDGELELSGSEIKKKLRRVIQVSRENGIEAQKMFEIFDSNGDKLISASELRNAAGALGLRLSQAESKSLVRYLDHDNLHGGKVDYQELLDFMDKNEKSIELDDIESKIKAAVHAYMSSKGDKKHRVALADVFATFDLDGNGKLKRSEFKRGLKKLDINLSDSEFKALMKRVDKNHDNSIDYEEFVKKYQYNKKDMDVLATRLRKRFLERAMDGYSFQETFRKMDGNGDGMISRKEFRDCLSTIKVNLTERELRSLMDRFDTKRKGKISYLEFIKFSSPTDSDLSELETRLRERVREVAKVRGGIHTLDMRKPFEKKDKEKRGKVTKGDFQDALRMVGLDVTEREFRMLCARFDVDGDDYIDYKAFCKFANLDDSETAALALRLRRKLQGAAQDGHFVRDVFAKHDEYNEKGRVTKLQFREGCAMLRLGLKDSERMSLENRFKALDDQDDIMYLDFLKWVNAASASKADGGWRGGYDDDANSNLDLLNTTGQDDEVWNSRTVRTWLNTSASPRQRRRFNRLYASLSSYKQKSRRGGHRFPRATLSFDDPMGSTFSGTLPGSPQRSPRRGGGSMDIMGTSMRLSGTGSLAGSPRRLGDSTMGNTWAGNSMGVAPMSRLQLSAVETGDVTEQEFRDNRTHFQQSGNWACPVCMFPNNKGFSRKCDMCGSANPYMLPMGASSSPIKFSFTASPRKAGHIEEALDGTIAWRGDESDDDKYDSDKERKRRRDRRDRRDGSDGDYSDSSSRRRKDKKSRSPRRRSSRQYSDDSDGSDAPLSPRSQSDRRRRKKRSSRW
jgi:Ca2+-binding EF-hand superfamily protein